MQPENKVQVIDGIPFPPGFVSPVLTSTVIPVPPVPQAPRTNDSNIGKAYKLSKELAKIGKIESLDDFHKLVEKTLEIL